jgi:hypothetical protein
MSKGIDLNFYGLTYRQRLSIWWDFTKAILFKKDIKMKEKVTEINITEQTNSET